MKILFTTDGSPCSRHAIQEATRLVPMQGAEVYVAAVTDLLPYVGAYETTASSTAVLFAHEEAVTKAHLDDAVALLTEQGLEPVMIERTGSAAEEILAIADELRPDLIVVGSHGRNAVERFFLGSVSDAIVHRWHGAVLVVRPVKD